MTDIETATHLFQDAGLPFPTIPEKLAAKLTELGRWHFSTRPDIDVSPYNLQHYVDEVGQTRVKDYATVCHSGHGVNSYAIQYYIVQGPLRMFLHLGWGGVYTDAEAATARIRDCFSIADQIVTVAQRVGEFQTGGHLTVVASDFCGSYWLPPGERPRRNDADGKDRSALKPLAALTEALSWLETVESGKLGTRNVRQVRSKGLSKDPW